MCKKLAAILLSSILALMTACSSASPAAPASQPSASSAPAVSAPAAASTTPSQSESSAPTTFKPIDVSFLHGAGGSTWPLFAEGVAESIRKLAPGSVITTVPGGAIGNAELIATGEYEMGFTFYDVLLDAKNGRGSFTEKVDNMRVIACIFSTYAQPFCLADQPFNTMQEFIDQKPKITLSAHQSGSGVENFNKRMLDEYGVTYDAINQWGGNVVFANESSSIELMKDGQCQMFLGGSTPPVSNNIDLNATRPIKYLSLDPKVIKNMVDKYGYSTATIPKDVYSWLNEDFDTFTAMIVITCTTDLPDDDAYMIAKAVNENIDYLTTVHGAAKLQMVDVPGGIISGINDEDIHPGALKYFKEAGLK